MFWFLVGVNSVTNCKWVTVAYNCAVIPVDIRKVYVPTYPYGSCWIVYCDIFKY